VARQKLGQHFLHSKAILERIAAEACPEGCDLVVEIGPGKGALTEYLLRRATRVKAVELDPELAAALAERWRDNAKFEIVQGNALETDWSGYGPGVLAGNLPYYVASAIISSYLLKPGQLESGVFLIQKEVADRITAKPGTRDYGFFSVECQYLADVQALFRVPPGAFHPPPKVDSAVVRITPHRQRPASTAQFLKFASACFRQKRKTLRNNLSGLYPRDVLDTLPESPLRAEQLPVERLFDLYQRLAAPTI
jgi:16S rRNA (adenine1518-N6/adenine1519-N6)-dimethyltransferase